MFSLRVKAAREKVPLPLILLHSGFRYGHGLTAALMTLLIIVVASGIFGAVLQHYMPHVMTREITHLKAFMVALAAMDKDPLTIGLIEPTPKMVDQYFNSSTGEGDTGEKDLLGPWNDNASVERVDAPAFQDFVDSKKGTRTATPISGPELDAPVNEAPQPAQKEPLRAEVKKNGKRSQKYA